MQTMLVGKKVVHLFDDALHRAPFASGEHIQLELGVCVHIARQLNLAGPRRRLSSYRRSTESQAPGLPTV